MKWQLKSLIQNTIAMLPGRAADKAYYQLLCKFGGLTIANPIQRLGAAIEIVNTAIDEGAYSGAK